MDYREIYSSRKGSFVTKKCGGQGKVGRLRGRWEDGGKGSENGVGGIWRE